MSMPGIVFIFIFLQNVAFSWLMGIPSSGERIRKGRRVVGSLVAVVSILTALVAVLLSRLAVLIGAVSALPPFILAFSAAFYLAAEILLQRFLKEKPPVIREWAREAEGSGIAFAVALAVSGKPLGLGMATLAAASSIGGYFFFAWAFRGILDRLRLSPVPRSMRGAPLVLLSAALVSFAFMALDMGFLAALSGL